jgi:UDP:flavonoid glycosyltransferase YjiC (YdhE family)
LETVHRPFLWAIREGSATESLPPAFRSGNLAPETGLVVAWAPQRRVLEHSSVGVFVSHCGWNSLLESVWSGIPVVGCPRIAEQNLNLWLLQEWGIGVSGVNTITGGKGSVRHATLAAAVRRATHPSLWSELRERAAGLAAAARAAVSPSGSSTQTFQKFVRELLQTS